MKNWILCKPADRQTLGSMRYILETCQDLKNYTHNRIFLGNRRNNRKPLENLINEWGNDYLRLYRIAEDAPRHALRDAIREVLVNGIQVHPRDRKDYQVFTVEPRPGWRKASEKKKTLSWGDYLEGKEKKDDFDRRTVTPDAAIESLFERGLFSFRWGQIQLRGEFTKNLQSQAKKEGIDELDFLKRVKEIDFMRMGKEWENWKVNFNLER